MRTDVATGWTLIFKDVHISLQRLQGPFPSVEIYYTDHFQAQIIVGELTGANNVEVDTLALALADRLDFHYGWRFAMGYIQLEGRLYRSLSHHFWEWTIETLSINEARTMKGKSEYE